MYRKVTKKSPTTMYSSYILKPMSIEYDVSVCRTKTVLLGRQIPEVP